MRRHSELLADYLPYGTAVHMPAELPRVPTCRDPTDRPFLELAIAGSADCLVSGDKNLLSLASRFDCAIVTAQAFLDLLG